MANHALCAPSGHAKWSNCAGALAMEQGVPNTSSKYSDEGTAAHFLASTCLEKQTDAVGYIGREIVLWAEPDKVGDAIHHTTFKEAIPVDEANVTNSAFIVDVEMACHVQCYVDAVRRYAEGGDLLVEQRLIIAHLTGEEGAEGTSDAVVFADNGDEMIVIDLKYGMGEAVSPDENGQLSMYALGALPLADMFGYEVKRVRLVIHQPRINPEPLEWACELEHLLRFGDKVPEAAQHATSLLNATPEVLHTQLTPGEKQCRWCRAKAICPAIERQVVETIGFENLEQVAAKPPMFEALDLTGVPADKLAQRMAAAPLVEMWCKAVRAETERRLLASESVPGWKLVQGKKGNRQWGDEAEAEEMMKAMRIKHDQMYSYKLISPTTAEKLAKSEVIGKRQWPKLQALITQADGKPSVAPESNERPALDVSCGFVAIEEGEAE